jgi:hypothetical protein
MLRNPETVRNPRRPDGTRQMSGWSKDWFRSVTPATSYGWKPIDGYVGYVEDYSNVPSLSFLTPGVAINIAWLDIAKQVPFTPSMQFYTEQVAKTKVLGKLSQKKFDLGVTALELKQTAGLVNSLAKSMVDTTHSLVNARHSARQKLNSFFRDVRRQGDFYKAAGNVGLTDLRLLEDVRSRWMEYQFGVRPLLRDISDSTEYLAEALHRYGRSVLVKARAGYEDSDIRTISPGSLNNAFEGIARVRETCQVHYSVVYEIPTGSVSELTALGLDNPWSVVWETTQLSWMFDYVIGIGDWLQSFTATNGMVFREGSMSVLRRVASESINFKENIPYRREVTRRPSPKGTWFERGSFSRSVLASGITPGVVPQIKSELGLVQLANSIFALSNVFQGKPGMR